MDWNAFSQTLSETLNLDLQIINASSQAGGDIHQAYRLHTNQGDYFLKRNDAASAPMFATEANSLKTLADTLSIQVPKALATGTQNNQAWLLLEYLELTSRGDDEQRGKDLALLHHQVNPSKQFGWAEDNYIGHTLQTNTWHDDWIAFYGEVRLRPQLDLAMQRGAQPELMSQGEQLIDNLPRFFEHYHPEASPLHGDLWGGNSAFTTDGEAVFFDPASYYGDREADLAMTELFGGFSDAFYRGYNSVFPLDAGYKQRKTLYNLYHILNHYNLFGGSYQTQAIQMMQTLSALHE